MKRDVSQIKRLATSKVAPFISNRDESVRVPRKKKVSTGVLKKRNSKGERHQSTMGRIATVCCARSQECLSQSKCHIDPRTNLVSVPINSSSRKD